MKKRFVVEFIKIQQYHIEAEDMNEAENIALELDESKEAEIEWATKSYEEIRIEEE